jgi:hypothetical protein
MMFLFLLSTTLNFIFKLAELYGITEEELVEVKRTLGILRGEDVER